jgi:cytochrome b subunit of formate dehydrogenase
MTHRAPSQNVPPGVDSSLRMTVNERLQHGVLVIAFTTLAVTGFVVHLPRDVVQATGLGSPVVFEVRGVIHRASAVVLILVGVYHALYALSTERGRWQLREMWWTGRDWRDFRQTIRHYRRADVPRSEFGWFSYLEKVEYWALVWGTAIMTVTGFILWFETLSPKWLLDLATVVHRYEAILAVLAMFVWHFYHVHLAPDVFPMSPVWLSGRDVRRQTTTGRGAVED